MSSPYGSGAPPPVTQQQFQRQNQKSGGVWKWLLGSCLVVVLVCIIGAVGLMAFAWPAFVNFGIATDCEDYIVAVKAADLSDEHTEGLVGRIDQIREEARNGNHVGFVRWLDHDTIIRGIYQDGEISENELETFRKELSSIEKAIE